MNKKRLRMVLEFVFIVAAILWLINIGSKRIHRPLYEPDEAAWIYSSYYFNLYFLKFGLFHQDWEDYDAYDHPPLVKYIVGATLFLKGHIFNSLAAKKMWFSIPMNQYGVYYPLMVSKVPKGVLPTIRSVILTFAFLSVLLIYIFLRKFYGIIPAIIGSTLLILNLIFIKLSPQITADPVLLFFFICFILTATLYIKSGKSIYLFGGFIFSSLAFLTKLNGLILIFILFFVLIIRNGFSLSKYNFKVIIFGFATFLMITILLNPFFLNYGIKGIFKMIDYRISHIPLQQKVHSAIALTSVGERVRAEISTIFLLSSAFHRIFKIPFEFFLFLLGVYYSIRKKDLILLTILFFFILLPLSVLPLNWSRYYYTVVPFICIIAGTSLNIFGELGKRNNMRLSE
jgi:hypothetical protein